jgi:hypothetical protein
VSRLVGFALVLLAAAAGAASAAPRAVHACTGAQLTGTFSAMRGSEGAGNIEYRLVVENRSHTTCTINGVPAGTLLNKAGRPQTTHVINVGGNTIALVIPLAHGKKTHATARFSPDVPGVGEGAAGKSCEPASYWFRLKALGGGTVKVKLSPTTPVCEHGRLQFSYWGH